MCFLQMFIYVCSLNFEYECGTLISHFIDIYIYVLIYERYCIIYVTYEHVLLNVNKVFSIPLIY